MTDYTAVSPAHPVSGEGAVRPSRAWGILALVLACIAVALSWSVTYGWPVVSSDMVVAALIQPFFLAFQTISLVLNLAAIALGIVALRRSAGRAVAGAAIALGAVGAASVLRVVFTMLMHRGM